jgi:hypothetical protein
MGKEDKSGPLKSCPLAAANQIKDQLSECAEKKNNSFPNQRQQFKKRNIPRRLLMAGLLRHLLE